MITNEQPAKEAAQPEYASPKTTKIGKLEVLLFRPGGADMPTMMEATAWQAHSVRGAIAGALRKRGLKVRSELVEGKRTWTAARTDDAA